MAPRHRGRGGVAAHRHSAIEALSVPVPGGSHWTRGQPGWEEVADDALSWALEHARMPAA